MVPSVAGAIVCGVLLLVGWLAGDAILVALFAALPFGATAIVSIPALGGSSPLIYTIFVGLLILKVARKGNVLGSFYSIATEQPSIIIAAFLAVYALSGAIILPRLFAGETTVFVPIEGAIREVGLAPSGGNITQPAYFVMGIAAFAFMTVYLSESGKQNVIRSCLFSYAIANTLLGFSDLAGKLAGGGDVLAFIRTASYQMLSEEEIGGFTRIAGGCSEASAFAATSLASLGFTFVYWRKSGSPLALGLTVCLLVLLIFSTSSTAYVGVGLLGTLAAVSIGATLITADFHGRDLFLFFVLLAALTLALGAYLYNERLFDPFDQSCSRDGIRETSIGLGARAILLELPELRSQSTQPMDLALVLEARDRQACSFQLSRNSA